MSHVHIYRCRRCKKFAGKNYFTIFLVAFTSISVSAQYNYPVTKTVNRSDTYWGVEVKDPYYWLENLTDSTVLDWYAAQSSYTNAQLNKIPGQERLIRELKKLDKVQAASVEPVAKAGGKYFYQKRLPGEPAYKLFYRHAEKDKEVLLFDPQTFRPGKIVDYLPRISDDGSKALLIISETGGDLGDIYILDVASGRFLPDMIPHSRGRFSGGSNTDIVYLEYASSDPQNPENILNCPFKLHVLGTPLSNDYVLAEAAKYPTLNLRPEDRPWVSVYENSPYIILELNSGGDVPLFYAQKSELKTEKINWIPLAGMSEEIKDFFVNGTDIYLLTSKGNPRYKIIKTSLSNPDITNAVTVSEGKDDWKISTVEKAEDYLLINFSKNELVYEPHIYSFKTGQSEVIKTALQGNTQLRVVSAKDNEVELIQSGWNIPMNCYRYDIKTKTISKGIYHRSYTGDYPELNALVSEEVEVPSHDGTLVPLSVLYNKDRVRKDGSNPCLLIGYGAYGASFLGNPYFNSDFLPLLNRGFVIAFAHVRGGGEKGNDWHLAGKKVTKPNTWKDFIACAEWLIRKKYASSGKMACLGASAGGILIGRSITERPDLFRAAICYVGVLNAVRTEFMPSGPTQIAEFGTVKDSVEFKALLEMDAYHQIKPGVNYPAQLITASFKDFRVQPYMPAKFAARMQAASTSSNPVLLYVDFEGGHFGSNEQDEVFMQLARDYAFLLWQIGHPDFQPEE